MPVAKTTELARTYEHEVGRPAIMKRRWVCILSDDTLTTTPATGAEILTATGTANWGTAHPEFSAWKLRKVTINEGYEGSPYSVEVVGEYSIIRDEETISPVLRPSVWSFEATKGEVPAFYYYPNAGSNFVRPLTNSAFDYFPGLTTSESLIVARVKRNFQTLPYAWIQANNYVNNPSYLGGGVHTWKCNGVEVSYVYEEFGGTMIQYWSATANLLYRQSSHNLLIPDVGFNFISGTEKRRAMVFDFKNAEWVASPTPVGLDGFGGQTLGAPAVLNLRVCPDANFSSIFGTPPA